MSVTPADVRVPVLIVGGGRAGLTASMLMSTFGVQHLLVSSLPTTSALPKAHVLQQRAMEVFSDLGVAGEIYERGTPPENMSHTAWYLDVAGHEMAGRLIHKMAAWTGGHATRRGPPRALVTRRTCRRSVWSRYSGPVPTSSTPVVFGSVTR